MDTRHRFLPPPGAFWKAAAAAWLLLVLAVCLHQWSFWRQGRLDTDILALLPRDAQQSPALAAATRAWTDRGARQVAVLVGAPDWSAARAAATAWQAAMDVAGPPLRPAARMAEDDLQAALRFYRPWRDRLLTPGQRRLLAEAPPDRLAARALALLQQPGSGGLSDWRADPLGLWQDWWSSRGVRHGPVPRDGRLALSGQGREWVLLLQETAGPAFSLDGRAVVADALAAARDAALRTGPGVQVLATGVPLYAEAAAVQASREVNLIGWGSLAAVLLLVGLSFGSLRPILLVGLSLLVGTAVALSATALVFGRVHLLTLVFGASLVGVAEDYGIHYFAARQGAPDAAPRAVMRRLLPGLAMALSTSVLAYLLLGVAPLPGLRQMALFSAVGLVAAFLTVVCWLPLLDRGRVPPSRLADAIAASLVRWPRWPRWPAGRSGRGRALAAALALFCLGGWWQLRVADDTRQLQRPPAALLEAQQAIGRLLPMPGAAQFFRVQGADVQQMLEREEALVARLAPLVDRGDIAGVGAVSQWVPSRSRQHADAALTAAAEAGVLQRAGELLGEDLARPVFAAEDLGLEAWLAEPVSQAARHLWLGRVDGRASSIVVPYGLQSAGQAAGLAAAAAGLPGVQWVDRPAEVSGLLRQSRHAMTMLLVGGHAVTLLALWWRFRAAAWRAWLPAVLATGLTLAALGWLGQPLQLFNILALLLLLGIGVDYGIFLLEHRGDGGAWLAVVLGAASTWLAFGLLGLSTTPALRAFGLTLMIGIALVWALCPLLRPADTAARAGAAA